MKYFLTVLFVSLSFGALAEETLSKNEAKEAEAMLVEAASKLLYVDRDCDKPIDFSTFKDLAKLKAFSEGYETLNGVSWKNVKKEAHVQYGSLKMEAPMGELCDDYAVDLKGKYKWLKDA